MISDVDLAYEFIGGAIYKYYTTDSMHLYIERFLNKMNGCSNWEKKLPDPRLIRCIMTDLGHDEKSGVFQMLDNLSYEGLFIEDGENRYCNVPEFTNKNFVSK
ncbi:hypothetical protein HNV12_02415 [Methanococcoides sp. SA1]|nr:hypothetical protein [Methanococcoides sp. SA1]